MVSGIYHGCFILLLYNFRLLFLSHSIALIIVLITTRRSQKRKLIFLFFFLLFMNQVPSDWPVIETSRAVDGQSIFMKWKALQQKYANGILRGYTIWYYARHGPYSWRSLNVSADQLQVTVTGLQICSWYRFWISAFTSKGEGPRSYVGDIKTCMYIYTEVCCHLARAHVFQVKIKINIHVRPKKTTHVLIFSKLIKSRFVQAEHVLRFKLERETKLLGKLNYSSDLHLIFPM